MCIHAVFTTFVERTMSNLEMKEALRLCKETTTIEEIIDLTKHARPEVRKRALQEMCPCRVKADVDEFWFRVLEMVEDPDNNVRQQVGMVTRTHTHTHTHTFECFTDRKATY